MSCDIYFRVFCNASPRLVVSLLYASNLMNMDPEAQIPLNPRDYLILFSTLGGLALFGLSGFVIGPVIASLFLAVWTMFAEDNERSAER